MKQSAVNTKYSYRELITVWETEHLELEAGLAASLIERWGMVCAMPDGEDSGKRQKLRLQTPQELVERAFHVSNLFMETARAKGLVHVSPDLPQENVFAGRADNPVDASNPDA